MTAQMNTSLEMTMRPIGFVRAQANDSDIKIRPQPVESTIELLAGMELGLEGIDGFSHVFVMFFMHRLDGDGRNVLQVKPRRMVTEGLTLEELPTLGVFACDSPVRPNPIGLSVARLVRRDGRTLHLRGLDAFDGSPVIDIKPYTEQRIVEDFHVPRWREELRSKIAERKE